MTEYEKELVGETIYKYRPVDVNTLKTIVNKTLWFSKLKDLNDPFEGQFIFEKAEIDEVKSSVSFDIQNALGMNLSNYAYLQEYFDRSYRLTCFSRQKNVVLMWSHYADCHKGICLGFDRNLLVSSILKSSKETYSVLGDDIFYTNDLIKLKKDEIGGKVYFLSEEGEDPMFSKLVHWNYEEEYRFVLKNDIDDSFDNEISFNPKALKEIIFGRNTPKDQIFMIKKIITSDPSYGHIIFKQANLNFETAKMTIKNIGR